MSGFKQLLSRIQKDIQHLDELAEGDKAKSILVLAQKIKLYRKEHKLSQDELARKLFVTKMAVIKWEMGRAMPSTSSLQRLKELGIK
jgi:DNA-binding transcriptional regulator YiaG